MPVLAGLRGDPVSTLTALRAASRYREAMTVERGAVYLPGVTDKQRVKRWRYVAPYAFQQHVTVGWLPDGSWWVEASWHRLGAELFVGDTSAEARQAAEARAAELMAEPQPAEGRWEPTIAVYEPGVVPARPAAIREWPPGHEPVR